MVRLPPDKVKINQVVYPEESRQKQKRCPEMLEKLLSSITLGVFMLMLWAILVTNVI